MSETPVFTEDQLEIAKQVHVLYRTNPSQLIKLNNVQKQWAELVGKHQDATMPPEMRTGPVTARTKVLSAANKFLGKTCASVQNLTNIIWGPQNKYYEYNIYKKWPFPKNVWIVSSASALREVIVPEMEKWFPKKKLNSKKKRYWTRKGHKDYPYFWQTDTGFRIWLKTYDEDPESFESTLIGLVLLSEPPPQGIYDACPPRLSQGGIIMIEMTPLAGCGWIYEDLVDTGKADIIYGEIYQGSIENGGRHTKESIKAWIDTIRNPDEKLPRIKGKPSHYAGSIYKSFTDNYHVVDPKPILPTDQIWFVIDPHGSKPPFAQWFAINTVNELRCVLEFPRYEIDHGYEEIADTRLTIKNYCDIFLQIEKEFGYEGKIVKRIMDPFFGAKRHSDTEFKVRQMYARHGINCVFPPKGKTRSVEVGHQLVRNWLHFDLDKGIFPRLTYERHCMNSIRAMKRYAKVIPKNLKEHFDKASDKFQLTEKFKHAPDCTRYVIVFNPSYMYSDHQKPKSWRDELLKPKVGQTSNETEFDYRAH